MRAVVCTEPGTLLFEQRAAPTHIAPGWVMLEIACVGICGTDYHIFEGKHPFLAYPRVMGHELSGRVAALGDGVDLPIGSLQIVNPYLSCGTCIACRKGKPNCCTQIQVLGVHTDGGMCDRIVIPAANLYPAGTLSSRDAAMVEFLAIGAHAVRRAVGTRPSPAGERALVVGVGPIGIGTALFARIAGFDVTLVDASPERLAFAADSLGFPASIVVGPDMDAEMARHTDHDGFDVIFDATGQAGPIEAGFTRLAHGGTYVLVSVVKDRISFADPEFHKRETTLLGSRNATRADFEHVTAMIAAGAVPLDKLATHRVALEDLAAVMPTWVHDRSGLIKAIVEVAP